MNSSGESETKNCCWILSFMRHRDELEIVDKGLGLGRELGQERADLGRAFDTRTRSRQSVIKGEIANAQDPVGPLASEHPPTGAQH